MTFDIYDLPLEKRRHLATQTRKIHPDRVPVMLKRVPKKPTGVGQMKTKYLVPEDMTVGGFCLKLKVEWETLSESSSALFLLTENSKNLKISDLMIEVYTLHKNEDGLLYLHLCEESTFGSY